MKIWLNAEHLTLFLVPIFALFVLAEPSWWWLLLFFWPDMAMVGYLLGTRLGAVAYNLAHVYALGVGLVALSWLGPEMPGWLLAVAFLQIAHVGFDRLLGYGLKYPDSFGHTHLGWLKNATKEDAG